MFTCKSVHTVGQSLTAALSSIAILLRRQHLHCKLPPKLKLSNYLTYNQAKCHLGIFGVRKVNYTTSEKKYLKAFISDQNTIRKMRLVQFIKGLDQSVGVELCPGGDILDLTACCCEESFPRTMVDFLSQSPRLMEIAKKAVGEIDVKYLYKPEEIQLLAPVTNPDKVICIGMNYRDHCEEQGVPVPTVPVVFSKFSSTIIGPNDDLPYPEETEKLDWEVELAIVIGKVCKAIKGSDANEYIAGYTVAHDVSARDWQLERNGGQWLLGKSMDGFCPLGPVLCTADDVEDVGNLEISCSVNGEYKQRSSTKEMVHKPRDLVAFLSRFITLLPGDVILTGTPPGVGVFKKPPQFLKRGDVVECSVEGIGTVKNKVV